MLSKLKLSNSGKLYLIGGLNYNGGFYNEYLVVCRPNGSVVGYADQAHNLNMDIAIDSSDNAYITGHTTGGTMESYYIYKVDSVGTTKWAYVSNQENAPYNIMYKNGEVYLAGQFHYQITLADTVGSAPITLTASANCIRRNKRLGLFHG